MKSLEISKTANPEMVAAKILSKNSISQSLPFASFLRLTVRRAADVELKPYLVKSFPLKHAEGHPRRLGKPDRHQYFYDRNRQAKLKAINAYGGECACCQERQIEFLTIDHIFGGGKKHHAELAIRLYRWLGYSDFLRVGFRVLCWNCNEAYEKYGHFPHKNSEENLRKYPMVRCVCYQYGKEGPETITKLLHLTVGEWTRIQEIIIDMGYSYIREILQEPDGKRYAFCSDDRRLALT